MELSIVIPAFNEEKYIGDCIESCLKYAPPNLKEIIVIDNASTDKTAEVAGKYPKVRVVHESWKGLTRARARGLKEMQGDIFLSMDADTRAPAGWFQAMQKVLEDPTVVCASGPYSFYDVPGWKRVLVNAYWSTCATITYLWTGYMLVGGNFAARKSALLAAGGFDRSIEFYGEDTDIGRRLYKLGKVKYSSKCWIHSSGRRLNTEGLIKTPVVYALNYIWIALFHRPFTKDHTDIR